MSLYLKILLISVFVPFIFSFYPGLNFYKRKVALFRSIFITSFVFVLWDIYATASGHWHFATDKVYPLRLFGLPLEEILFFFVILFCCIFTWEVVKYFLGE